MRWTRVPQKVARWTKFWGAQRSPELALRSTDFRVPENLIFSSPDIITTKFKLLSHFLTPMSIALINIAVNQYDATLNIIIWHFSRGIYFDGDISK